MAKSEFILKAERRAKRLMRKAERSADAHVEPWHEMRREQEFEAVAGSVARQRALIGATGNPERSDAGPKRVEQSRSIPDPSMTDAEFLYQKRREQDRSERLGVKPRLDIGKVQAQENAMSRMGALCFIRPPKRQDHHERAAEQFKTLYEARYGLAGGSMDPSRIQVDTSPIAHDSGMAAKIDRTSAIKAAEDYLGPDMFRELVRVIILESPVGEGLTSRPAQRAADRLLDILDLLAEFWGAKSKAA